MNAGQKKQSFPVLTTTDHLLTVFSKVQEFMNPKATPATSPHSNSYSSEIGRDLWRTIVGRKKTIEIWRYHEEYRFDKDAWDVAW